MAFSLYDVETCTSQLLPAPLPHLTGTELGEHGHGMQVIALIEEDPYRE